MNSGSKTTAVTVVGIGSMGKAVARAFLAAGYETGVWNRNAQRAQALVTHGAVHYHDLVEAVSASPVIVAVLTSFEATREVLEGTRHKLAGRTLITLNTGTPAGARAMADWVGTQQAAFVAGAVKNTPDAVGLRDTQLCFSGDRLAFERFRPMLETLGGDTQFLGTEVDLAALYEMAVGGTLLPALVGFFQGAALVTSRGLTAADMVPHTQKWLAMIGDVLPRLAQHIDSGDYDRPDSALSLFHAGIEHDHEIGREGGIDIRWHAPMHELLQRAVAEGRADQSIAALTELLRGPPKG